MDILLKLFVREYDVPHPIHTASGTIASKPEILVAFMVDDKLCFAIELPLSPSAGESLDTLISRFNRSDFVDSEHIQNAISYFINMHLRVFELKRTGESKTYKTLGISQCIDRVLEADYIKIKTSPLHMDILRDLLTRNQGQSHFIIDFNASICRTELADIVQLFDDVDNFALEQPLHADDDVNVTRFPRCLFIADESLPKLKYPSLVENGYKGFVFKAFRNDYQTLSHCSTNHDQLFGVVGTNMSGAFDVQFSALLNDYMPTSVSNYSLNSYFESHPLNHKPIYVVDEGKLTLTNEAIDYIRATPELASFSVPLTQLEMDYDNQ